MGKYGNIYDVQCLKRVHIMPYYGEPARLHNLLEAVVVYLQNH